MIPKLIKYGALALIICCVLFLFIEPKKELAPSDFFEEQVFEWRSVEMTFESAEDYKEFSILVEGDAETIERFQIQAFEKTYQLPAPAQELLRDYRLSSIEATKSMPGFFYSGPTLYLTVDSKAQRPAGQVVLSVAPERAIEVTKKRKS